jgi:hypothetical protein
MSETISISGSLAGGTFQESLDYFADLHLMQVGMPTNTMDLVAEIMQTSSGGRWSPDPAPGDVIVPGPHDGSPADQISNLHRGLISGEVDFFPVSSFDYVLAGSGGGSGVAVVAAAAVPEPWSAVVLGTALLGFVGLKRVRLKPTGYTTLIRYGIPPHPIHFAALAGRIG